MTTLFDQDLTCPLCGCRFTTQAVGSFSIGEKDSDFCPRYLGANPLPHMVHVCPDCGYTGTDADFTPIEDAKLREKLQRGVESMATQKEPDGVERYRRLALLLIQRGAPSTAVADAYLKASWVARLSGLDGEESAQRKAVQYFEMALAAKEIAEPERPVVTYLVGELYRRRGDINKAREWLTRAREESADKPAWLAKAIGEQLARLSTD